MSILPFAVALELVDIGEGSLDYNESSQETGEAHKGHEDVGGGEVRPGVYHWCFCR